MTDQNIPAYIFSFQVGDKVQYKNRYSKDEGYITNLHVGHGGSQWYTVAWSDKCTKDHYDFELELLN